MPPCSVHCPRVGEAVQLNMVPRGFREVALPAYDFAFDKLLVLLLSAALGMESVTGLYPRPLFLLKDLL